MDEELYQHLLRSPHLLDRPLGVMWKLCLVRSAGQMAIQNIRAIATGMLKVQKVNQTVLTVLKRKNVSLHGKRPRHFTLFV